MTNPSPIPFSPGRSWVSPDLVAGRSISLSELRSRGDRLYWLEGRPQEGGRTALVSFKCGETPREHLPPDYDVGTRVHEYGGGAYCVGPNQRVAFSNRKTDQVMLQEADGTLTSLSCTVGCAYAEFSFDTNGRGVFCVREDYRGNGEPKATVVWLDTEHEIILVEGDDFYAAPRAAPDNEHLVWVSWSHPDMPWDATRLTLSELHWDGGLPRRGATRVLSGESSRCSCVDPVWETPRTLLVNSDEMGRWQPCRFPVTPDAPSEFLPDPGGETGFPHWVFGQQSLHPLPNGELLAQIVSEGVCHTGLLKQGVWMRHPTIDAAQVPVMFGNAPAWIRAAPDAPPAIVLGNSKRTIKQAFDFPEGIGAKDCATPRTLAFQTKNGRTAHALYYAPITHDNPLALEAVPPLVVMVHGGPTGRANTAFSFKVQWWTSRGFAVLDVNYRGSTGFGRAYRMALEGQWGIADVEDCIAAVRHATSIGLADGTRCVIRGSSAGGLTVLMALASSDVFSAGCSIYGVTDLRALAQDTHKFESRYLDRLIGRYPEQEALYLARSPLTHVTQITSPVLFLHGDQDKVVPLGQAQAMHERLLALGRHSELHVYAREGHGFRREATLTDSLVRELGFYQRVFNSQRREAID